MTGDPCNHDWTVVHRYDHRFQAEQAQQLLETSGVSTMIQGDDASGWAPHIGFGTGGISLLVPAADIPKALTILGETDDA